MPISVWFWIIYVLGLFYSWWAYYDATPVLWIRRAGGFTIVWALLGILGYRVFGSVVK
jgi:hypothetical protein